MLDYKSGYSDGYGKGVKDGVDFCISVFMVNYTAVNKSEFVQAVVHGITNNYTPGEVADYIYKNYATNGNEHG